MSSVLSSWEMIREGILVHWSIKVLIYLSFSFPPREHRLLHWSTCQYSSQLSGVEFVGWPVQRWSIIWNIRQTSPCPSGRLKCKVSVSFEHDQVVFSTFDWILVLSLQLALNLFLAKRYLPDCIGEVSSLPLLHRLLETREFISLHNRGAPSLAGCTPFFPHVTQVHVGKRSGRHSFLAIFHTFVSPLEKARFRRVKLPVCQLRPTLSIRMDLFRMDPTSSVEMSFAPVHIPY